MSHLYQRFLQLIVYPNIWVSAAIASLTLFVQDTLVLPFIWRPAVLIFCAALIPYNLDRVIDTFVQKDPNRQDRSFFRSSAVWVMLIGAAVGTGLLIYQAPPSVQWVSLGGLIPLIYGLPLFPWRRYKGSLRWYRIKDIPGTKAWLVCGSITYAVVAVPLAYAQQLPHLSTAITALWLLIFIGSNSHMFDIRDIKSDRKKGVLTLPLLTGVKRTRLILTGLNGLTLALLAYGLSRGLLVPPAIIALPATLLSLVYIWALTPKTPHPIFSVWIDGVLFLPAILIVLRMYLSPLFLPS